MSENVLSLYLHFELSNYSGPNTNNFIDSRYFVCKTPLRVLISLFFILRRFFDIV